MGTISLRQALYAGLAATSLYLVGVPSVLAAPFGGPNDSATTTPIKHVIVIIGENRSFDHMYATYQPSSGQHVLNLLSEGIVNSDGTPGPDFAKAKQNQASDTNFYTIHPTITGPFITLPPPNTGATHTAQSDILPPPFKTIAAASAADYGLPSGLIYLLTLGASGLPNHSIDTRIANANSLPSGPYQMSPGVSTADYSDDPVHRFYQMWQQTDCSTGYATRTNPSGCRMDLFPWVAVTVGTGNADKKQPAGFNDETTGEGGISMGFYNMSAGDEPFFRALSREFTIGDNFHQSFMGGTTANHIMLMAGDAYWFSDGHGNPITPPAVEIVNPNPQPGTNNWYTMDGYPGGSYTECSDTAQPGVASIVRYLNNIPSHPKPNCLPGIYYMVDNHMPAYLGDGTLNAANHNTEPPSATPTIGDVLLTAGVSWTYYGEGFNTYLKNPASNLYCSFCNAFQYESTIMTNAAVRTADIRDSADLYSDIAASNLPAVSFVKPQRYNDGHPVFSKIDILAGFVKKILLAVQANSTLAQNTAVFITFDEGGGFYDSGYIQPLDFFGDGPRIPLIVVSRYSEGGRVIHSYGDHVSILKFIEKNWSLPTISSRSRDNLPDPTSTSSNPYVPTNAPAIDDLMDFFRF